MRVAILGGSFDPIHVGHLQIAKTALKKMAIDEVWFMPAMDTPLKDHQSASFYDRCQMIALAIKPFRHMKLCTLEGEREERSYTIDTVMALKKRYPRITFSWLIGDDQAKQFDAWKESARLLEELSFYVFSREERYVPDTRFHQVCMPLIPVSSSMIRKGEALDALPKAVRRYMGAHGLYIEELVRQHMSEHRYLHSVSVANLCVELANCHHLDPRKAYVAGMVHDVCKQDSYESQQIWMKHHLPELLQESPAIWHGYLGAYYAKHTLRIQDKEILNAIFHHVKGRNQNEYERILYIADKLDPSRGYDSSYQIEVSKQDLKKGFELVRQEQTQYLEKEGVIK